MLRLDRVSPYQSNAQWFLVGRRSAEPQTKGFRGGMPSRLRIRLCPTGSWVRRRWGWRAPKLLLEIIAFCEKNTFFAGHRRSLVCPLAVTRADYLPARRLNRVRSDPVRFAYLRAGFRFRCVSFESARTFRGFWSSITFVNLRIRLSCLAC